MRYPQYSHTEYVNFIQSTSDKKKMCSTESNHSSSSAHRGPNEMIAAGGQKSDANDAHSKCKDLEPPLDPQGFALAAALPENGEGLMSAMEVCALVAVCLRACLRVRVSVRVCVCVCVRV